MGPWVFSNTYATSQDPISVEMCLINQLLDVLLSRVPLFSDVFFYQDIYSNRLLYVQFEKEEFELLCIVFKTSNQIKVFVSIPLLEVFIYLCFNIP